MPSISLQPFLDKPTGDQESRGFSKLARALPGSDILRIADEVRARLARNEPILNLTVGDFDSRFFPIPLKLTNEAAAAVQGGQTHYSPAAGVMACRTAVQELFESRLGLSYPIESVVITGGTRPAIASTFLALLDPGDVVAYSVPSWNNHYYATLVGANAHELQTTAENHFFPSAKDSAEAIKTARLLCINTPQNPTGTMMAEDELTAIGHSIVQENDKRIRSRKPPVYLLFDQVYWMLALGRKEHVNPVSLVPQMAPFTIFADGISKGFAATGLRVGWAVGPPDIIRKITALSTHLGSWAPRPEQIATAETLRDTAGTNAYLTRFRQAVAERLNRLKSAIDALAQEGHPVEAIAPQGAIYLSLRLSLVGRKTPEGTHIQSDEDTRRFLLEHAKIALVPFSCFGVPGESGWFRASVGAISPEDGRNFGPRLKEALERLK